MVAQIQQPSAVATEMAIVQCTGIVGAQIQSSWHVTANETSSLAGNVINWSKLLTNS